MSLPSRTYAVAPQSFFIPKITSVRKVGRLHKVSSRTQSSLLFFIHTRHSFSPFVLHSHQLFNPFFKHLHHHHHQPSASPPFSNKQLSRCSSRLSSSPLSPSLPSPHLLLPFLRRPVPHLLLPFLRRPVFPPLAALLLPATAPVCCEYPEYEAAVTDMHFRAYHWYPQAHRRC